MSQPLSRRLRAGLFYALRTAFRITPMPESTRGKLRQRFLDRHSNLIPPGPKGQVSEGVRVRRPYVRSDERAIGYVPYSQGELPDPLPATLIAFYLPQFHTIPENDEWWGKGFTEWRNVTRALPQFEGHHQPKLPGDLGFYDLRNPEVMREQARLAREYGISAFCFYFYWFGGKTLLETPLRNWLNDKTIDLKFCLCWANEKWTRTWDGRGNEVLIDQQHSPEDDIAFIEYVAEYMRDPRYLRIDDKPMLLVYRPGLFPNMVSTAKRWRIWCMENGIGEIHLAYVQSFERPRPTDIGFDAAVEFPPNLISAPPSTAQQRLVNPDFGGEVIDWKIVAEQSPGREQSDYWLYPCVNPGWDNEARRPGRGRVYLGATPIRFSDWLQHSLSRSVTGTGMSGLVFINAWNEWAEGAVMEPDARNGYAYLEATRQSLRALAGKREHADAPYVIIHAWHLEEFQVILQALHTSGQRWRLVVTTVANQTAAVESLLRATTMSFEIIVGENRGRDILPFLRVAHRLLLEGEDVVLKLHTKRSSHRDDGAVWHQQLLDRLLAGERVQTVRAAFAHDPRLGMVGPEGHCLRVAEYVGGNAPHLEALAKRMSAIPSAGQRDSFFSGSMFWLRLRGLTPLFDCDLVESEFESEDGQVDGTLAHAIERSFALTARTAGYDIATVASLLGEADPPAADYTFARRS